MCCAVLCHAAGQSWSCCPRSALKRALSSLESRFGLTVMAGFELEFVLLKPANLELFRTFPEAAKGANVLLAAGQAWVPVDDAIYGQASAMSTSTTAGGGCSCWCCEPTISAGSMLHVGSSRVGLQAVGQLGAQSAMWRAKSGGTQPTGSQPTELCCSPVA